MMRKLVLSAPAARDVEDIVDFVRDQSGEDRARHVASGIRDAFEKVARRPNIGHRREDLTPADVWFLAVWSYLVIYRCNDERVEIGRVIHGGRDIEELLRGEA